MKQALIAVARAHASVDAPEPGAPTILIRRKLW
jgi:hypothetical protein